MICAASRAFATLWDSRLGGGHSPSAEKGDFPRPCRLLHSRDVSTLPGSGVQDSSNVLFFPRLTSLHESSVRVRGFVPESLKSCGFHGAVGPSDGILRSRALVDWLRSHGAHQSVGRGERVTVRGVVGEREALRNTGLTDSHGQSQISRGVLRVICAWCSKVITEGDAMEPVSHGICESCAESFK